MKLPVNLIEREQLAEAAPGSYIIADEQAVMEQYDPVHNEMFKGAHLRMALVKHSGFSLSGIPDGIKTTVREDGCIVLEAWVRADQLQIVREKNQSAAAKFVCVKCSKQMGMEVVSSKPSCPRCTAICKVVGIEASQSEPLDQKIAERAIGHDLAFTNEIKMRFLARR